MNIAQLNMDIVRALGVDPKDVSEVTLYIRPAELPRLVVRRVVRDADGLRTAVEMLDLAPRKPE